MTRKVYTPEETHKRKLKAETILRAMTLFMRQKDPMAKLMELNTLDLNALGDSLIYALAIKKPQSTAVNLESDDTP